MKSRDTAASRQRREIPIRTGKKRRPCIGGEKEGLLMRPPAGSWDFPPEYAGSAPARLPCRGERRPQDNDRPVPPSAALRRRTHDPQNGESRALHPPSDPPALHDD